MRSCCTSWRSELARETSWPVGQLVVTGEVESLEPLEQRVAQVVLHVDPVAAAGVAPEVLEDEVDRREADEDDEQRADRLRLLDDRVVGDRALDERQDRRDDLAGDGDAEAR